MSIFCEGVSMEQYHHRIPRKQRAGGSVPDINVLEERLRLATTPSSFHPGSESMRSAMSTHAPREPGPNGSPTPCVLEELLADKTALEYFHECPTYQRETYLELFCEFVCLRNQAPQLVADQPEKRSLSDLCVWQQLRWLLTEQTYMGEPLEGFSRLPGEHRMIAALCCCEAIVERMAENDIPFHAVMSNWNAIIESVRGLFLNGAKLPTVPASQHGSMVRRVDA
jgi:hypothetical protein